MKITYRELVDSVPSLNELTELKFMPRTSLDLSKALKKLDKELANFNEKYKEAVKDLEDKDLKEKTIDDLLGTEVEVDVEKINFSTIERTRSEVSPNLFNNLEWFINDDGGAFKQTAKITKK